MRNIPEGSCKRRLEGEAIYGLVTEDYKKQIDKIEIGLELFKLKCDELFNENKFGTYLQEVMQEIYINFYETSKEKLSTLWAQAQTIQEEFTSNIINDDKM